MKQGTVEKIINGGWGLVRSDEGVVFLNYVLPGEDVHYRIKEKARGILWGELSGVLSPARHRVEPPCPYFGQCGGCIFQHIEYRYQKTLKRNILQDDLKRIGAYEAVLPGLIESPPYQNRIRARMKAQEDGKIGFIRKGTNRVIPINHCLLFPRKINRFLEQWNALEHPPFFHQMDILMNRDNQEVYIHLSHSPKEEKEILKLFPGIVFSWKGNEDAAVSGLNIKGGAYRVSPAVFFQVNPFQWENMLNIVDSYLEPCDTVIDLYSGVGFFIPLLKKYAKRVIGVESDGFSVTLARRAFPGVEFFKTAVEKFDFPGADVIILDPPRSGISKYVMNRILNKKYNKIIYISCSSAAFSRDLKILGEHSYQLEDMNVLDLFPQTAHLEIIAYFTRITV